MRERILQTNSRLLRAVKSWENSLKILQFGQIVIHDIRIAGIVLQVILVVILSWIKGLEGLHLCHQRPGLDLGAIELRDVSLRDPLLLFIGKKNHRAIL